MRDIERAVIRRAQTLHSTLADAIGDPSAVWCRDCGREESVDAAHCLRHGWPQCCGQTMTIDPPDTWSEAP